MEQLRKLNEEELKTLERLGGTFMNIVDCARVLEVDVLLLKKEMYKPSSEAYRAYHRGFLKNELAIRESVMEVALRGSNPAQVQIIKFIEGAKKENGK